jgi:hypothetical protein
MPKIFPKITGSKNLVWFFPVILLWGLIILPSSFKPVWGSIDDGVTLTMASKHGFLACFSIQSGRIFYAYWLHNWFLHLIGGKNPTIWYSAQTLEFLLSALCIYLTIGILSSKWWIGALSAGVFLCSSTIAENAYTISKCEPRLALFSAGLCLGYTYFLKKDLECDNPRKVMIWRDLKKWVTLSILSAFIVFSKESTFILPIFGITCILFSNIYFKGRPRIIAFHNFLVFSIISLSFVLILIGIKVNHGIQEGYASSSFFGKNVLLNLRNYTNQSPDTLIIILLTFLLGLFSLIVPINKEAGSSSDNQSDLGFLIGWGAFATGLAYLVILLLWRITLNYYMLPVVTFFSISLGCFTASIFSTTREESTILRAVKGVLVIGLVLLSSLYSIPYIHFIATAQRISDRIGNEVAQEAVKINSPQKRIVDLSQPYFAEPPVQRTLLYKISGFSDFSWVGGIELFTDLPIELKKLYNADNLSPLKKRPLSEGDLLLLATNSYPFNILLRGVGPHGLTSTLADNWLIKVEKETGLSLFKLRSWHAESVVYKPWTLKKSKLIFDSTIYRLGLMSNMNPGTISR